jgi:transcriptional regulator with PAS, ATPase and Fis domain
MVLANGGTLFLDEIGDMPLHLQARLLRALQERTVSPLGSNKLIQVDVAVVCATHRNMREMMASGQFREDLYYRLNGFVVRLPALRERDDLDAVAQRLLQQNHANALPLSEPVTRMLRSYHWPGNIRQLANLLRTAQLMAEGSPEITEDHLPDDFLEDWRATRGGAERKRYSPQSARRHRKHGHPDCAEGTRRQYLGDGQGARRFTQYRLPQNRGSGRPVAAGRLTALPDGGSGSNRPRQPSAEVQKKPSGCVS